MKVGILGYGKEGQSAEKYFHTHGDRVTIFDNIRQDSAEQFNFDDFDLVLRSPSIHPQDNWSSMTQYFFAHCPCKIIGVTGTKGKGTTCSLITDLLKNLQQNVYLVGNIGTPSIEVLDGLQATDVVVYELSSFQLWDLKQSPQIAVVLRIEPDHLNIHDDYEDYVTAKANIAKHQTSDDYCIYFAPNSDSTKIAQLSPAHQLTYPVENNDKLNQVLQHLAVPGKHNQENAEAALLAVASFYQMPLTDFLDKYYDIIVQTFEQFQGLPHRLQYLRTLNHVKYFDDNFSTTPASLAVALQAFPDQQIVAIIGGRDKTENADLPEIAALLHSPNIAKVVLIGESGHDLFEILKTDLADRITTAKSLTDAVKIASKTAETLSDGIKEIIVLMSPAAASFDMFENVYARGAEFQKLIQEL